LVKTFNGENDSSGVTDTCLGCSRPHTASAHSAAKIDRVKDLAAILLIGFFRPSKFHFLSKSILSKRFATYVLLTQQPFNVKYFY